MRPLWCVFALSMLAAVAFDALPAQAQDERAADGLRLTLSSQTVWQGAYGWCSLSAEIELDKRWPFLSLRRCRTVRKASPGPGGGSERRRTLTDSETAFKSQVRPRCVRHRHERAGPPGSDPFSIRNWKLGTTRPSLHPKPPHCLRPIRAPRLQDRRREGRLVR
jgi:hypothetical protein